MSVATVLQERKQNIDHCLQHNALRLTHIRAQHYCTMQEQIALTNVNIYETGSEY